MADLKLKYHVNEVRFGDDVRKLEKEDWFIGHFENSYGKEEFLIKSPKGDIYPTGVMQVDNGVFVGLQFETDSYFPLGEYGYHEDMVYIKTVAIVRQPHNAWLWAYLMDENDVNIATFCGYDDLDGLARFIKSFQSIYGDF